MYNDYFGLREAPFSIAPNPQYLYMSERHREALAHLLYGIRSDGGFILLTGEVGTGKTTVCRCLLEQIPEDVDTAFILNPKLTASELLATACDDLHIDYPKDASIKVLVDALNDFLLRSHQLNRRTVLIIDEAQNLSVDVLEQLRLLTNLETNQRKLLQIILLGQPELLTLLAKQELRQLSQRVTARFHLDALTQAEVGDYIQHRLDIAGAKGALFPKATINRIYAISKGIPRIINLVCDRALLGTYVQNKLQVDVETVNKATKEILGDIPKQQINWHLPVAAAVIIAAIGITFAFLNPSEPTGSVDTEQVAGVNSQTTTDVVLPEPAAQVTEASDTNTGALTNTTMDTSIGSAPEIQPSTITPIAQAEILPPLESTSEQQVPETDNQKRITNQLSNLRPVETTPISTPTAYTYNQIDEAIGFPAQTGAFEALLRLWGNDFGLAADADACEIARTTGLECLSKLGSLRDIAHLNRPVIINLTTSSTSGWFVISGITDDSIKVQGQGGEYLLKQSDVLEIWSGFYSLLWRSPPAYSQPSKIGDQGPTIDWLWNQMELASNPSSTGKSEISDRIFDAELERRVKRFQISVGLIPDGIVGAQTWIHINNISASGVPVIRQQEAG